FGMPINILDALVAVGVIFLPFTLGRRRFESERMHTALKWSFGLLLLGTVTAALMGFITGCDQREMALMSRNVLNLAICLLIGYASVTDMRSAKWAGYIVLVSSFASACAALIFMRESTETLSMIGSTLQALRSNNMGGDLGVVLAGFIAFCLVSRLRYIPWIIGLPAGAIAVMGSFALPHRTCYVVAIITLSFAVWLLPRAGIGRRVATGFVLAMAAMAMVTVGVILYSRVTGRNFKEYVETRVISILPNTDLGRKENHAWDTRLPGIMYEMRMWISSPLFGRGFGSQEVMAKRDPEGAMGFRHNVWTSSLAEGGLPLFLGFLFPCVASVVVGWRMAKGGADRTTVMIGAIGALEGVLCFVYASCTMSINVQRPAIPLGLICGLLLRTRQIQAAVAQEYAGYLDPYEDPAAAFLEVEEYA
ncbi:MAG TPA: O-antigen ligase family protein, partial [Tepidisphaeraceae bacterium]